MKYIFIDVTYVDELDFVVGAVQHLPKNVNRLDAFNVVRVEEGKFYYFEKDEIVLRKNYSVYDSLGELMQRVIPYIFEE